MLVLTQQELRLEEAHSSEMKMLELIVGLILPAGHRDEPRGPLFVFLALFLCLALIAALYLLGR